MGSFTAAAVTAKTYSPVFPLSAYITACSMKACASPYLLLSLQSRLDFVADGIWGVWALCIFASGCVLALEEVWVKQTPPRGEDCQSSHGESWLQTVLPGSYAFGAASGEKKISKNFFFKVFSSFIAKLWRQSSVEVRAWREPAV